MNGIERIAKERKRQIEQEDYNAEHDEQHGDGEIALAAACYATPVKLFMQEDHAYEVCFVDPWPWEEDADKRPRDGNVILPNTKQGKKARIRQLEKAGALIAAEIDRLLGAAKPDGAAS